MVIACRVMEPELTQVLAEGAEDVEILYLDSSPPPDAGEASSVWFRKRSIRPL